MDFVHPYGVFKGSLKRDKSLKRNSDFRRLYSKGKSAVNSHLVVYSMPDSDGLSKVGFTVSAKLGKAVARNRIRRRLREIYRLNSIKPGYDIIVVARSKCVDAEYHEIESAYLDALSKLNLLP